MTKQKNGKNNYRISLRAAAEFNTDSSKVLNLQVISAKLNQIRQEIITVVKMDAIMIFDDLEYLPVNVSELQCKLNLNITLTSEDIKEILKHRSSSFPAELYIMSKDIEITEKKYIKLKDSLSNCDMIVNMSLEREIDKKLNDMNYAIEIINIDYKE